MGFLGREGEGREGRKTYRREGGREDGCQDESMVLPCLVLA